MSNEIRAEFAAACFILKSYLVHEDPQIKFGETKYNDEGFYLDFLSKKLELSSKNFLSLNKQLLKLAQNFKPTETKEVDLKTALEIVKNDPFESQLIKNSGKKKFVFVSSNQKDVWIWHEQPVYPKLSILKAYNLLTIGGAYWEGDEKNAQLVRISGCAFKTNQELTDHLKVIEERRNSDHRKIGKDLDLFTFNQLSGKGMAIWLPKGTILKDIIGNYVHNRQRRYGFDFVSTSVLGNLEMYKMSGHYTHYNEDMFPPIKLLDGDFMMLRPMTCPHHSLVYLNKPRTYKDLPIRLSEDAILHRYEASGGLTGLERVRSMTLLDNHIFCRADQIESEITNSYNILEEVVNTFGLKFERVDLALHDPKNKAKFIDDEKMWKTSELQLEAALKKLNIKYTKQVGDAAFYGPKIDFQIKTVLNKIVTISTIQLDFSLPNKFNLTYFDKDKVEQKCVVVHLGIIGTYERFVATLLEQTKGILPLWLAPVQVKLIPVNNSLHLKACKTLKEKLYQANIRAEIDMRDERLAKKIREAQINKIPMQMVIGDKEAADLKKVNYRNYGSDEVNSLSFTEFVNIFKKQTPKMN
ncbi:threonine--tRNA ligase [[Mycoplasma] testudinis]|uniref:threonine--tRNA ligase n=1 Tax=[Mycoplasma] testudinis TaxID=33924 RepID=UPI0006989C5D|nr:threonine--tRNA ligase [[Mycoplasma] testudinis]